jgi:hypothetical protein
MGILLRSLQTIVLHQALIPIWTGAHLMTGRNPFFETVVTMNLALEHLGILRRDMVYHSPRIVRIVRIVLTTFLVKRRKSISIPNLLH